MKKSVFLGIMMGVVLFSCSKDEEIPLNADFIATVSGESPNAEITITNNTTGASTYEWTFAEGADVVSSVEKAPAVLKVDKSGDFKITLIAGNGSNSKEVSKTVSVAGSNAIITYKDLEFALDAGDDTYGRLFSFETEKMYKDSEIDGTVGPKIHLAFGSLGQTMYFFESPTAEDYNVPNATTTKVTNWLANPPISEEDFDAIGDDKEIAGLTIEDTNDSFGNSSIPGTVLFETSVGKKGVIKTKAVNASRLLVDIKVQKY